MLSNFGIITDYNVSRYDDEGYGWNYRKHRRIQVKFLFRSDTTSILSFYCELNTNFYKMLSKMNSVQEWK